jgi:hypothetical protein
MWRRRTALLEWFTTFAACQHIRSGLASSCEIRIGQCFDSPNFLTRSDPDPNPE